MKYINRTWVYKARERTIRFLGKKGLWVINVQSWVNKPERGKGWKVIQQWNNRKIFRWERSILMLPYMSLSMSHLCLSLIYAHVQSWVNSLERGELWNINIRRCLYKAKETTGNFTGGKHCLRNVILTNVQLSLLACKTRERDVMIKESKPFSLLFVSSPWNWRGRWRRGIDLKGDQVALQEVCYSSSCRLNLKRTEKARESGECAVIKRRHWPSFFMSGTKEDARG